MFYLLGDLFQFLFTPYKIPYLGFAINWILTFAGAGLLTFWCARIISFGAEEDKPYDGI